MVLAEMWGFETMLAVVFVKLINDAIINVTSRLLS